LHHVLLPGSIGWERERGGDRRENQFWTWDLIILVSNVFSLMRVFVEGGVKSGKKRLEAG
jgi:hypothetical protein